MNRQMRVTYPAGVSGYTGTSVALAAPRLWRSSTSDSFGTCSAGNMEFAVAAENLPASGTAFLGIGFAPASIPMPGGEILVDPLFVLSTPIIDGSAKWSLPLPADPALVGVTAYAQCAGVDGTTGALVWSNGLVLIVQP